MLLTVIGMPYYLISTNTRKLQQAPEESRSDPFLPGIMTVVTRGLNRLGYENEGDFKGHLWTDEPLDDGVLNQIKRIDVADDVSVTIQEYG